MVLESSNWLLTKINVKSGSNDILQTKTLYLAQIRNLISNEGN